MAKISAFVNGQKAPLLLDLSYGPYFSWKYREGFPAGFLQTAYQIEVLEDKTVVWDSGKVSSGAQQMIPCGSNVLQAQKVYLAQVTVWGKADTPAAFCTASFETGADGGMLAKGSWIGGKNLLRHEFELADEVKVARAYASCIGYYELRINGVQAGDQVLSPSHTDFEKRVEFQGYDVTSLLQKGKNAIGLILGGGLPATHPFYVEKPHAIAMLYVELNNGEELTLYSSDAWRTLPGPITDDNVYTGEKYDARLEQDGWDLPGFTGMSEPAAVFDPPKGFLTPQVLPPIRIVDEVMPCEMLHLSEDVYRLDYGQNFTGVLRIKVQGPAGTVIKMRHGEMLNRDGSVNQLNLRIEDLCDVYTLKGEGIECYQPRFTYHGFRYVEVSGWPGEMRPDQLIACVIHSDVPITGHFTCSDKQFNEVHNAMHWTFINNLHSLPSDCPQRDERRGWMADAHVTSEANIYNHDMHWFYRKWHKDILDILDEETGRVKYAMAPRWIEGTFFPWSAALFIIPYRLLQHYDDRELVKEVYPYLKKNLQHTATYAEECGLILEPGDLDKTIIPWDNTTDDWLAIDRTRNVQVINGFYYQEYQIMHEFAKLLNLQEDAAFYEKQMVELAEAYNKEFLYADNLPVDMGIYGNTFDISQYGQALPLRLGITPPHYVARVVDYLLWDLMEARGSIQLSTGVLGTECLIDVLSQYGRDDTVAALFARKEFPGWGFMLSKGSTTVWEKWFYMVGCEMNSHNHPALGAPDKWLYYGLAGLGLGQMDENRRREFKIKPYAPDEMEYAKASCDTPWGLVTCGWRREGGVLMLDLCIPANTTARVCLGGEEKVVGSGKHIFLF